MRFLLPCILLLLIFSDKLVGQQLSYPVSRDFDLLIKREEARGNAHFFSVLKPYVEFRSQLLDSLMKSRKKEDSIIISERNHPKLWKKIKYDNLFNVRDTDIAFTVDPVFDFQTSQELKGARSKYFINTRGFIIQGKISKNLEFYSSFFENQARFPEYVRTSIIASHVIPGNNLIKYFKETGFDYASASGRLSYYPFKWVNIQLGNGKHFIGEGYRSLLLSDNSYNYPFLQTSFQFWKIQYTSISAIFQDIQIPHIDAMGFYKKYATFHLLTYNINSKLNVSLFDGIMWKVDRLHNSTYRAEYLNPLIFSVPISEGSMATDNNSLVGLNLAWHILHKNTLYGQLAVDDYRFSKLSEGNGYINNKWALQLGWKSFDILNIKLLNFQMEYNVAKPYMYAAALAEQNYSHYNQSITHPAGANFQEMVMFLNYRFKDYLDDVIIEYKFNYLSYGADTSNRSFGKNIFISDQKAQYSLEGNPYWNEVGQGKTVNVIYNEFRIAYVINPRTNMRIELGVSDRMEQTKKEKSHLTIAFLCFRTDLSNMYLDF